MDFANEREIKYAHDILLGELPDFDEEKINIIKCNESKDVKACPGSGKTTTLLAKLVTQVSDLDFRQFVHMPVVLPASCCFR